MKYYYGIKNHKGTTRTVEVVMKGTVKVKSFKVSRVPYFDSVCINNYWYDETNNRWIENGYIKDWSHSLLSDKLKDVPKSAKAFNRYVQKLLVRYSFPKGTVIQLSGRFRGIGIFCIL